MEEVESATQENTATTVIVDGQEVSLVEFHTIREQVDSDPNKKLKEVSPGVWKTLSRLTD